MPWDIFAYIYKQTLMYAHVGTNINTHGFTNTQSEKREKHRDVDRFTVTTNKQQNQTVWP